MIIFPKEILPFLKSAAELISPKAARNFGTVVRVICKGDTVEIVATDSYRLKHFILCFPEFEFGNLEFNLSKGEIAGLLWAKDSFYVVSQGADVSLKYGLSTIGLTHDGVKFPNFREIFPKHTSPLITVNYEFLGGFFPREKGNASAASVQVSEDTILYRSKFKNGIGVYLMCKIKEET